MNKLLGKLPKKVDPRTLQLAKYLVKIPDPPKSHDQTKGQMDWGMMGNDNAGDCTCAAAGHLIQDWTLNASKEFTPSDADIIKAYSAVSGYDPRTGANDNGAVCLDVLNYWRKTGIAGHKIGAFVEVRINKKLIEQAIYLFGGVYLGINLPLTAQTQKVWKCVGIWGRSRPGSWGGHAVGGVKYDKSQLNIITWAYVQPMTWCFVRRYCDEAYVILSMDFINQGKSPEGFDLKTLQDDLNAL